MTETQPARGSLVLYKSRAALVESFTGKKLEIRQEGGESAKVRPKDVVLLHPGPLTSLSALRPVAGEIDVAWELLAGGTCSLSELAELAYGEFSAASAWSAWQHVQDGLLFSGQPDEIFVHTAEDVAIERAARSAKQEAEQKWTAFLDRVRQGSCDPAEDADYLADVVALANRQRPGSHVLQSLGREESPEQAHALLLEIGLWDEYVNPYPDRAGVPVGQPAPLLGPLLEEARVDLTDLPAFAIDDAGSVDPDDALSYQDGRLFVHIADVAALVPPDSPADLEARARAANLYLPEGTVHMLPREATSRLALGLAPTSPALTFVIEPGENGNISGLEIMPSRVRVTRLSYEEAEERLTEQPFADLAAIGQRYMKRRLANGAVTIDLPEVKVKVVEGRVMIEPLPNLASRDLVREAMLMVGEAVAGYAQEHAIPIAYSTQEAPELDLSALDNSPAGMFALRRKMRRSQQRSAPAPHGGLGMAQYSQVTSPLRRYLDLVAHQQLRAYLAGGEALLSEPDLMERVGAAEAISGDVRWVERRAIDHWRLVFLLQNPQWQGAAIVVDQRGTRYDILIPELALETSLYLRREVPLNSRLTVQVSDIDLPQLEARFRLLDG